MRVRRASPVRGSGAIRKGQCWRVFRRVRDDDRGATAAEYAVILGVIGASLAVAALQLSDSIACSIDRSSVIVAGGDVAPGHQYGHSDPKGLAKGHRKTC